MAYISPRQFRALAEFRYQIRSFLKFSELAAKAAGVEPQQHQLMLVVKAVEPESAGISYLADRLHLRHHSVVGLIDRLETAGMVKRTRSEKDRRSAEVRLTTKAGKVIGELSLHHRKELRSTIPALIHSLEHLLHEQESKHVSK